MEEKKFSFVPGARFQKSASAAETKDVDETRNFGITARFCDWLITIGLGMIFLGIPLFFTGLAAQGIAFEKQVYFYFWLLLAMIGWATKSVLVGEMKIRKTPLDIPIAGFIAVYVVSTILSIDRWHSFWGFFGDPSRGLINVIALAVAYYLIVSNFTLQRAKWLLGALAVSNFIVSAWVVLAVFGVKFLPQALMALAPVNVFGSFSALMVFVSLMIPLLIAMVFKAGESAGGNKIFQIASAGFLLVTIALNFFLMTVLYSYILFEGWIAILAGIVLFLVFILSRIVQPKIYSWSWLPIAAFVVVMALFMVGRGINVAKINLPVEVNLNYSMTAAIAKGGLKENFFFGSGPATYVYNFSLHRPQNFNDNALYNLRFFQGTGVIGESLPTIGAAGTFFLILLLLLFISIAGYFLARDKEKDKVYSLGLVCAVVVFLINSFVLRLEGPILTLGTLLSIVAFAAVLRESSAQEKYLELSLKSSPKYALAFAFVFMVISAVVIFFFVFLGKVYVADMYSGSALRQSQANDDSVRKVIKAIDLNNRESRYFNQLAQNYLILANNEALKGEKERNASLISSHLNNAISLSVKSRDIMKKDIGAVESLAQVYENSALYVPNTLSLAEEQYNRARELEPHNPLFFVKLGQLKATIAVVEKDENKKKEFLQESKAYFEKAVEKKNNFALGYFHLALANEALGDKDKAIENLNAALMHDRQNINYAFNLGRVYTLRGQSDDLKTAEFLYKKILEANEKEINAIFYLGLLYEKMNEKDKAIGEYERVLNLIPAENKETREQVEKMIENVRQGVLNVNIIENAGDVNSNQPSR